MSSIDAEQLLHEALSLECQGDSFCAQQAFWLAAAEYSKACDLLKSRNATMRPYQDVWYMDCDESGILAACRILYKKAGCCMFLRRHDDALSHSKEVLQAAGWHLKRQGGWGREVFGPAPPKALYRWGQALHAVQHLAAASSRNMVAQQAAALADASMPDGKRLSNVRLPAAGTPPSRRAEGIDVCELLLCSSPGLVESAAGMRSNKHIQIDRWHVVAVAQSQPPPLLPDEHSPPHTVPLPMLPASKEGWVQPLGPLLAAYMAQKWCQEPGAPLLEGMPEIEDDKKFEDENDYEEEKEEDDDVRMSSKRMRR